MIPIKDDNPTRNWPLLTLAFIGANVGVFFFQISLGPANQALIHTYGAVPADLLGGRLNPMPSLPAVGTLVSSMFLHGGVIHLGFNMLYLWIFGNNVEDAMGHGRFLVFYLICGVIAAYSHAVTDPGSVVPMIGASGAISGVLGAYIVLFPRARVLTVIPLGFFIHWAWIPAVLVLGIWIAIQVVSGLFSLGAPGGVAWFAHIGGFLAGLLLARVFSSTGRRRGRPSFV